jgi:undecaprenyl diphosphate synthase
VTVLPKESLPRHVAIIMDGNGRWAKKRFLPRIAGHKAGVDAVHNIVKHSVEQKIDVLTLFAFSSENWGRPAQEVDYLMSLFHTMLEREINKLHKQNIQLRIIGDRFRFDNKLQHQIEHAEQLTKNNSGLKLVIAANYGGHWDICEAARILASEVKDGSIASSDITPDMLQSRLSTADLPSPDLLIRTSGEQRISNFMLWQLAYSELYFSEVFWPDFDTDQFDKALAFYANRERRFGFTSEQLRVESNA